MDKKTLKQWFRAGAKPLAEHFASVFDSFWHKDERLPLGSVEGLEEAMLNKADRASLEELGSIVSSIAHAYANQGTYGDSLIGPGLQEE